MARALPTPDHHHGPSDHDHGGTAIIHITGPDDDLTVWGDYDPRTLDYVKLSGDDRRAALERVRAAIDAELDDRGDARADAGDAGQPDPAAVVAALCRRLVTLNHQPGDYELIARAARHGT